MNTSKIKVYIGTTIDGYIAIKNDSAVTLTYKITDW